MKKLAVFGNPVAHSLSPTIHQMFAKSCGEIISYTKIECAPASFAQSISDFFLDPQAVGCNITMPFKQEAYRLTQAHCDPYAEYAEAVNTLFYNEKLCGYNTDGIGLVSDLIAQVSSLQGSSVLLIGAGGAARGVVVPLLDAGVKELYISNRTGEKAQRLVEQFSRNEVQAILTDELTSKKFDVVVNCTSASLHNQLPDLGRLNLGNCELVYDMVYGSQPTVFMDYASTNGAPRVSDGLGMLVGQAAEAFYVWTGKRPDTAEVQVALRTG
ncbi:shikimate dehydrogenase [Alteromonas ponticola]|uniref:Shikimate dehydrogenase (NADP(+)) n=1 Tax=Alteromonas ponticola TaxID=2720613 RepID=A0ABX1R487_9ALTE|nr:shikimate dehydrogenase [Alteromonas ponticola]NMH60593.1 shikimate dehydrogenase [Alteromonas ponticola]